jgi:predicted RNA-binding protein (virulence factor B family)
MCHWNNIGMGDLIKSLIYLDKKQHITPTMAIISMTNIVQNLISPTPKV